MKKTCLIIATLFATSFAMAQNTATVNQIGNNNDFLVDQIGKSIATVTQKGNENESVQYQIGKDNVATISQIGANSRGAVAGIFTTINNYGTQNQSGSENSASIIQEEQGNHQAFQTQIGINNIAKIYQRNPWGNPPLGNYAIQFQRGKDNKAFSNAFNENNRSIQLQDGNENWSLINQAQAGNIAEHEQNGNGNYAFSGQDARKQTAEISQFGNENIATTRQNGGTYNVISIDQRGNGNNIGAMPYYDNLGENYGVVQIGNLNITDMSQIGDNNHHFVRQYGNSNRIDIDARGNLNEGIILQKGDLNKAILFQGGLSNVADIRQMGNSNLVMVTQR